MIIGQHRSQPAGAASAGEAERESSPVSTLANLLSQRTRRAFTQPPPVPPVASADTGTVGSGDAEGGRTDARGEAAARPPADRAMPSLVPVQDEAGPDARPDALAEGLSAAAMAMRHPQEDTAAGATSEAPRAGASRHGAPNPGASIPVAAGADAISAGAALERMVHRFFDDIDTLERDFRQSVGGVHAPQSYRRQ